MFPADTLICPLESLAPNADVKHATPGVIPLAPLDAWIEPFPLSATMEVLYVTAAELPMFRHWVL